MTPPWMPTDLLRVLADAAGRVIALDCSETEPAGEERTTGMAEASDDSRLDRALREASPTSVAPVLPPGHEWTLVRVPDEWRGNADALQQLHRYRVRHERGTSTFVLVASEMYDGPGDDPGSSPS